MGEYMRASLTMTKVTDKVSRKKIIHYIFKFCYLLSKGYLSYPEGIKYEGEWKNDTLNG